MIDLYLTFFVLAIVSLASAPTLTLQFQCLMVLCLDPCWLNCMFIIIEVSLQTHAYQLYTELWSDGMNTS